MRPWWWLLLVLVLTGVRVSHSQDKAPSTTAEGGKWVEISAKVIQGLVSEGKKIGYPGKTAGIAVDRVTGDVFMVIPDQGIWKSSDRGESFARVDVGMRFPKTEREDTMKHGSLYWLAYVLLATVFGGQRPVSAAEPGDAPSTIPPAAATGRHAVPQQHPRLLGSRERLKRLARERPEAYQRVVRVAREQDADEHTKMVSLALVTAIEGDEVLGKRVVDMAMKTVGGPIKRGHVPFGSDLACYATFHENPRAVEILRTLERDYLERAAPACSRAIRVSAYTTRDGRSLSATVAAGYVYARSSWDEDASYLFFKCGNRFTARQHLDVGNILIHRHGELIGDRGHYDSFGSPHDVNYHLRSIAHNTILVHDPAETWPGIRGGQVTGDYVYVAGDATRAYSPKKLKCFTRQIIYVRPDTFILFDRVVSRQVEFKKSWLLQAMSRPEGAAPNLTITNGKGRLFVQTLLPRDPEVRLAEGPQLYACDGKTYPAGRDTGVAQVVGLELLVACVDIELGALGVPARACSDVFGNLSA